MSPSAEDLGNATAGKATTRDEDAVAQTPAGDTTVIEKIQEPGTDSEDEIVYPGAMTKLGVGVGLALAILLVRTNGLAMWCALIRGLIVFFIGCVGSNHRSDCHSQDFRSFQSLE